MVELYPGGNERIELMLETVRESEQLSGLRSEYIARGGDERDFVRCLLLTYDLTPATNPL